jgi:arginyl-tRNA--protein-N-Asp/Glu arginylyltransferase
MRHFWYSFYDLAYANQSLGLWLMLDILRDAKKSKQRYCYLGTLYGKKGLYKMNFSPLEYWDGALWSRDPKALKRLIETDERG